LKRHFVGQKSIVAVAVYLSLLSASGLAAVKKSVVKPSVADSEMAVLWQKPTDIRTRDLFYGPGGKKHQPPATFTFVKEDLDGTNPKLVVRDSSGVKWKLKLGAEARPETVASRLIWAVGYSANEDYFLSDVQVRNLPARLHRGQKLVGPGGSLRNVRLKRYLKDEKLGTWRWRDGDFAGSRELNGLRVMMALINNWDLKDENNAVYQDDDRKVYMVSDLGASFGTAGLTWPHERAKGNLHSYAHSQFITKVTPEYVDFREPAAPSSFYVLNPREFFSRVHLRWIGKRVPLRDVKWMDAWLAQLSPLQIRDAFRAGGYSPAEVEGFARIMERRIGQLSAL